jgi:hypothetical protein
MSRTPYSPFVLKATAPDPWNVARVVRGRVLVGRLRAMHRRVGRAVIDVPAANSERFRRD